MASDVAANIRRRHTRLTAERRDQDLAQVRLANDS